ncbi:MAG: hypothetical protein R2710_18440 [Acidimicrobiales bacterium]
MSGAGLEVEILPGQAEHLAHTPTLAEQQGDRGAKPELLRSEDELLGVVGR